MTTVTTATYREYSHDPALGVYLIVNTDYSDRARLSIVTEAAVRTAHLDRRLALEFGTKLIAWCGSASSWAEEVFDTVVEPCGDVVARVCRHVEIRVEDGEATIGIGTTSDADIVHEGLAFTLTEAEDWTNDLGQRLIAFGWGAGE